MDKANILKWLLRADLLYREKLEAAELEELSHLWSEALQGVRTEYIEQAFRCWFAEGKFFPRPADINAKAMELMPMLTLEQKLAQARKEQ